MTLPKPTDDEPAGPMHAFSDPTVGATCGRPGGIKPPPGRTVLPSPVSLGATARVAPAFVYGTVFGGWAEPTGNA